MRYAGPVDCMREMANGHKILFGNTEGKRRIKWI
jgi:hypothetical protein